MLVALPIWNIEYKRSCICPERAPTIRSVFVIVLVKLFLALVLIFSTPRKRKTDKAIDIIVKVTVIFLFKANGKQGWLLYS